jgi:hypothetical protein
VCHISETFSGEMAPNFIDQSSDATSAKCGDVYFHDTDRSSSPCYNTPLYQITWLLVHKEHHIGLRDRIHMD